MNKTKKVLSLVLALSFSTAAASALFASCGGEGTTLTKEVGVHTYNTYTGVSPSNWNELTYQDSNDTQIMSYLGSAFFTYDFAFENGEPVDGDFEVVYEAATLLTDVTAEYAGQYGVPAGATAAYAYKITLREDLKWDDGTPIVANDFVYTMKEQLDPEFQHYRADSFYAGATVIHNAKNYRYQGEVGWYPADTPYTVYSDALDSEIIFALVKTAEGATPSFNTSMGFPASWTAAQVAAYIKGNYIADLDLEVVATMVGKTFAQIKAEPAMLAEWEKLIGWWQTEPNEELDFFVTEYTWPEVKFQDVGIFTKTASPYDLYIVLDQPLQLLKGDNSLDYKAAYNLSSLPLVHREKWEASKKEAPGGEGLPYSIYNSSVATTASWGPYKLAKFQSGKYYELVRNENWFGYADPANEGLYETDKIRCWTIKEWKTAWMKFLKGEIDSIGIDVSVAEDYKNSDQAFFTPDDYVGSLQLQSSREGLEERQKAGINKTILLYDDFRKALSLSIDRSDFTKKTTTASKAGYGLFGIMHYFAVENGAEGLYRNSDAAKKVLCNTYGVDYTQFDSLDEAVATITGYDLAQAKQLVTSAYNAAVEAGDISATDKVVLTYGSSVDNASVRRPFDYLNNNWQELMKDTPLEGRFELEFNGTFGDDWAETFRAGGYDICAGGWSGAAWDPGYMLMAYLSEQYVYAQGWDCSQELLKFTIRGVDPATGAATNNPEDEFTATMPLIDTGWWDYLNSIWGAGILADEFRVELIAALEEVVLSKYYTIPYSTYYSASLQAYKVSYITYDYNTFMGYGGIKYMTYNYDDAEWFNFVKENKKNGEIDYK